MSDAIRGRSWPGSSGQKPDTGESSVTTGMSARPWLLAQ